MKANLDVVKLTFVVTIIITTVKAFNTARSSAYISKPQNDRRDFTSSLHAIDVFSTANLIGSTVDGFYQTQPYLSAFVTGSVKATAADLVVQSSQGGNTAIKNEEEISMVKDTKSTTTKKEFDFRRTLAFWIYGGFYQGCVQEYIFTQLFPSIFGDSRSILIVIEQVATDMMILSPFLCLPVAYLVKAIIDTNQNLVVGLQRYIQHVKEEGLLVRYWAFWIPVQCLTFGVVPYHLRVPFIASLSFFWLMILSGISGTEKDTEIGATKQTE